MNDLTVETFPLDLPRPNHKTTSVSAEDFDATWRTLDEWGSRVYRKLLELSSAALQLAAEVALANVDLTSLTNDLGTLTNEVDSLSDTVSTHTGQISTLSGTVSTHTSQISSLSGTVSTHTGQISSLSGTVATHTGQISGLGNRVTDVEDINVIQAAALSALNLRVTALENA